MVNVTEENKLRWYGHICRMKEERDAKKIYETRINNERRRGRPGRTWDEEVKRAGKKRGVKEKSSRN